MLVLRECTFIFFIYFVSALTLPKPIPSLQTTRPQNSVYPLHFVRRIPNQKIISNQKDIKRKAKIKDDPDYFAPEVNTEAYSKQRLQDMIKLIAPNPDLDSELENKKSTTLPISNTESFLKPFFRDAFQDIEMTLFLIESFEKCEVMSLKVLDLQHGVMIYHQILINIRIALSTTKSSLEKQNYFKEYVQKIHFIGMNAFTKELKYLNKISEDDVDLTEDYFTKYVLMVDVMTELADAVEAEIDNLNAVD